MSGGYTVEISDKSNEPTGYTVVGVPLPRKNNDEKQKFKYYNSPNNTDEENEKNADYLKALNGSQGV